MSLFGAAALQVALDYAKAEGIVKEHDCVVVCQGSSPTLLQLMLDFNRGIFLSGNLYLFSDVFCHCIHGYRCI
jgi:hypothetical protein